MKSKKIISGLIIAFFLGGYFFFSPYQFDAKFDKRILVETILIKTPPAQVFKYLGNSDNAQFWSSFVSRITPLNPKIALDGTVGSVRRCFKNEDESGETWDEKTVVAEPNQRRRLTIFNLKNFPISSAHLLTEQVYQKTKKGDCRLSFSLFLDEKADWIEHLKLYYASYQISEIFRTNLQNIKKINESKYRKTLSQSSEEVAESTSNY